MPWLSSVISGYTGFALKKLSEKAPILYIGNNDQEIKALEKLLPLIDSKIKVLTYPAWDTVPYDRVDPAPDIIAAQIQTLQYLACKNVTEKTIILTTVPALSLLVPYPDFFKEFSMTLHPGAELSFKTLSSFLTSSGYTKTNTVYQAGEYAVRGGIIDIYPLNSPAPIRLDFFGNELESIKTFDPIEQTTLETLSSFTLGVGALFLINPETTSLFRSRYRTLFPQTYQNTLYTDVSAAITPMGLTQFFPLFHKKVVPFFTYLPKNIQIIYTEDITPALTAYHTQIKEYYDARCSVLTGSSKEQDVYNPLPQQEIYLSEEAFSATLKTYDPLIFTPFNRPGTKSLPVTAGHDFSGIRKANSQDIFSALATFIQTCSKAVVLVASSDASAGRLKAVLQEKNVFLKQVSSFSAAFKEHFSLIIAPLERGFQTDKILVLTETDIFGERIFRPLPKRKKMPKIISDVLSLTPETLVVHQIHGIGCFKGLEQVHAGGAIHDCLCIEYSGGDRLFVPVENMDVLSLYGSGDAPLDKIGGTFTARKERVKKDLLAMADKLIELASARQLQVLPKIQIPYGLYQDFCARFPYTETDDQLQTMADIEHDLALGKPMDRLVCGDVGFGKTEMALRAAFLAVMAGYQVAVIAPTTLLAHQHLTLFKSRFADFPVHVVGLSRLVSASASKKIKEDLATGKADIVIGTHAILAKNVQFKKLGLIVVDEEQHFGVAFKEKLKELSLGTHILTLTATPIPRTLQLSLSGLRDLSIIATPPVDRMAVKTFVLPFDSVILKEAILREKFRGGHTFFVCPRISDLPEIADRLMAILPDIRIIQAHGQMPAKQLEEHMSDFIAGKADILLTTSIIESGLDLATVNTIIVYRSDLFGLAALYQMRGRVGRGKTKAYAYFITPEQKALTPTAHKRLTVLQSLDTLGAGFTLASHDLDIRGAGNLLGDKQSGHIKEIGIALYQKMLAEAVQARQNKANKDLSPEDDYSPQINLDLNVLIPEKYVADLDTRMELYRRLGEITEFEGIEDFKAMCLDRFGPIPQEVHNLLDTVKLKILAKLCGIERLDFGPKGGLITLYKNTFKNPEALMQFVLNHFRTLKIRPDQKIVILKEIPSGTQRLACAFELLNSIKELV